MQQIVINCYIFFLIFEKRDSDEALVGSPDTGS